MKSSVFNSLTLSHTASCPVYIITIAKKTTRNGMNIDTGIDLRKLVDAGTYICNVLDQPRRSKAGVALAAAEASARSRKL